MASDSGTKVIIDIVLDDGSVKQVFGRIEKDAKKAGDGAGRGMSVPMTKAFAVIGTAAAATGALIAASLFKGAQAAMVQEDSVLSMNQALANSGRYSAEASKDFQAFASEIQRTTRIGDEAALSMVAMASNFAKSNDQAKDLTKAAIDLGAAMGMDAESAVRNLGKTFSGLAGELGEVIPEIRNLTTEQLKAGAAIDLVAGKFGGTAANEANNFKGVWIQMTNAFGDFMEVIGQFVTQSPVMVELMKVIRESFESAGKSMGKMQEGRDLLGDIIILTLKFGEAVNQYMLMPLEILFNVSRTVFNAFQTYIHAAIATMVNSINWLVQKLPGIAGIDKIQKTMQIAADSTAEVFTDSMGETATSFENILNVDMALSTEKFLMTLRERLESAKAITQEFKNNVKADVDETAESILSVGHAFEVVADGAGAALTDLAKNAKKNFGEAGKAAMMGIGNGAGQAFAAFGKAIHDGDNALEAFADSLLQTIGQASIQLGTNFILQGAAYTWAGMPNGPALMAAGAALAAFGGIMGAAGAPEPGTAGGDPMRVTPVDEPGADPGSSTPDISESVQERKPETHVAVNISGDVLDSDATGLRIVDILNQAFDKQGVSIKRGVMA